MPLPRNYAFTLPHQRPETVEHHESNAVHLARSINDLPFYLPQHFRTEAPTPVTLSGSSSYTSIFDFNVNKLADETTLHVEVALYVLKTTAVGVIRVGISLNSGTSYTLITAAAREPGYAHMSGFVDLAGVPRGTYASKLGLRTSTSSVQLLATDTLCVKVTEIPPST